MSSLLNPTGNSRQIGVSSAVSTRWVNDNGHSGLVKIACDVMVHVRKGQDKASSHDMLIHPGEDIRLPIEPKEVLNFKAYTPRTGAKEQALIEFSAPAKAGDYVLINDGVNETQGFTFGGSLEPGKTAAASAANLANAIAARVKEGKLSVLVVVTGTTLIVVNENFAGGNIEDGGVSDAMTVEPFAGGSKPGDPSFRSGSVWVTQVLR